MTQAFEAPPPIGGENLPVKELKKQKKKKPDKKRNILLIKILLFSFFILFICFGAFFGFYYGRKKKSENITTPSPLPIPSPSPKEQKPSPVIDPSQLTLQDRIDNFEDSLTNVDLQELELSVPTLDYDLQKDLEKD